MGKISTTDGLPILEVNEATLIGTWCEQCLMDVGDLVCEEFTFAANSKFVWRRLRLTKDGDLSFPRAEGTWHLEDNILKLTIEKQEDPDWSPNKRIHFTIRMRENMGRHQLVLQTTLYDDENQLGKHGFWTFPFKAVPGDADKNHREYQEKRRKKISLDGPFRALVSMLNELVPAAVGQLSISDPVFCVRLYFHDTHAPRDGYCCWVRCLTEPARQRVLQEERPVDVPDCLWHPTMGIANGPLSPEKGVYEADLGSDIKIMELYGQIYTLLNESEVESVPQLRTALRRASLGLHTAIWPDTVKRTDDFVVFPADGSNYFGGNYEQDMKASIPSKRLSLLRERGYLAKR